MKHIGGEETIVEFFKTHTIRRNGERPGNRGYTRVYTILSLCLSYKTCGMCMKSENSLIVTYFASTGVQFVDVSLCLVGWIQ